MSALELLGDLPGLAADASGPVAYALVAVAVAAIALSQRGLAGVAASWALGFLALHLVLGAFTGRVPAVVVLGLGVLLAAGAVAFRTELASLLQGRTSDHRQGLAAIRHSAAPAPVPAPAPRVAAPEPAPPEPSTHLWSSDGYRGVTGRSAP